MSKLSEEKAKDIGRYRGWRQIGYHFTVGGKKKLLKEGVMRKDLGIIFWLVMALAIGYFGWHIFGALASGHIGAFAVIIIATGFIIGWLGRGYYDRGLIEETKNEILRTLRKEVRK